MTSNKTSLEMNTMQSLKGYLNLCVFPETRLCLVIFLKEGIKRDFSRSSIT